MSAQFQISDIIRKKQKGGIAYEKVYVKFFKRIGFFGVDGYVSKC